MFQIKLCTADRLPCFGCQMCIKWPLKMYFLWDVIRVKIYYYIGNVVVNFFHSEWASARGINRYIGHKTKTELDANLRLFYAEARNGENYSRSILLGLRNGLERYLHNPRTRKAQTLLTTQLSNWKVWRSTGNKTSNTNLPFSVKTCGVWKKAPLSVQQLLKASYTTSGFMSPCISVDVDGKGKETWRNPVFYSSRMKTTNGTQPWPMTRQAKHAEGG